MRCRVQLCWRTAALDTSSAGVCNRTRRGNPSSGLSGLRAGIECNPSCAMRYGGAAAKGIAFPILPSAPSDCSPGRASASCPLTPSRRLSLCGSDKTISPLGFWVRGTARLLTRVISVRCRGFMKRTSACRLGWCRWPRGRLYVIRRCNCIQQRFVVVMDAVEGPTYCNGKYELELWLHQPTRAP
jgi:hypothetical protein